MALDIAGAGAAFPAAAVRLALSLAYLGGFRGDRIPEAALVAALTSGTRAEHRLQHTRGTGRPAGSIDRGVFGLNTQQHPEVSDRCAFNPICNAVSAWRISGHGTDWREWLAFHRPEYRRWIGVARGIFQREGWDDRLDFWQTESAITERRAPIEADWSPYLGAVYRSTSLTASHLAREHRRIAGLHY